MSHADQLALALESPEADARLEAAQRLAGMAEDARPAALALVRSLGTDDEELREWAVAGLEQLGAPSPSDLPALTDLVKSDNELVGYWACTLLGRSAGDAASAACALASAMTGSAFSSVQRRAVWALGKIRSTDPAVIAALQAASSGHDARLAQLAMAALEDDSA